MSRRILVAPFLAGVLFLIGLPRAASAQCTNSPVRGPAVKFISTLPCYAVRVTPDGATTPDRATNGSGYTASFTVTNTGYYGDTFSFTCTGSGGVTSCSRTPTSKLLQSGAYVTVTVTYGTGSIAGTGTLTLTATGASGQSADNGYYLVPIVRYGVAVTPDGVTDTARTANTSGYARQFAVNNTGSGSNTYTLTCQGSTNPVVTCGTVSPTSLTLNAGATGNVSVSYGVGAVGTTSGTLTLTAAGTNTSDNGWYSIPIVAAAVAVTPDNGSAGSWLVSTGGHTAAFTVMNTGGARNTFTLTCGGSGGVSCTGVTPASVTLAANATATATGTYSAGATQGTGSATLTATGGVSDGGSYNVSIDTLIQQAPGLTTADASPGATVERSLCLTVALGEAAAAECGDVRIVHALPTTRTMNKARTPTLLYNSQFAHPYPVVAANVTLPVTAVVPDSVTATLTLTGTGLSTAAGKWIGNEWTSGQTRRIALGIDASSLSSNVYAYTLEVRNWYGPTSMPTTTTGQVAIVNRSASAFGAGWWLAGLERLEAISPTMIVWVGGDGSVRQYQAVGSVWAAANVDHPDTLRKDAAGNYTRYDVDSLRVVFDGSGQHIATINRQGYTTTFAYSSGRLASITLPVPAGGPTKTYQFGYDANNSLHTVSGPPPDGSTPRTDTLTVVSGRLTGIRDPDSTTVQFAYDAGFSNRIVSRTDRRGTVTTFGFDAGGHVSQASLALGGGQAPIVTGLLALESRGLPGGAAPSSIDTALAYTRLDGPRTDVGDSTRFWLDRFGAPRKIVDALGDVTRIDRADPNWPGRATAVTYANGFQLTATYDPQRGRMLTSTELNPYGDGRNAPTTYAWDPKWDQVVKVTRPEGESDTLFYDAAGNRQWQRDARGSLSQVTFGYNARNQLTSITRPGTAAELIGYDALGNLDSVTTPLGFLTTYQNDGAGRATTINTPNGATPSSGANQTRQFTYDAADRDVLVATSGTADGAPNESVTVRKYFTSGLLDSLSRTSSLPAIGMITTRWKYDAAGRPIVEVAPGTNPARRDSTAYDPAGNPTGTFTRVILSRGLQPITMTYDAVNRLATRVLPAVTDTAIPAGAGPHVIAALEVPLGPYTVPADTATFTYDAMGRTLTANNHDAQVTRTYYANGLLATETQKIADSARSNFTQHVYAASSAYDLDGRRVTLTVPSQFQASTQQTQLHFAYNSPAFGPLTSVSDLQGVQYTFQYSPRSELQLTQYPASYRRAYGYDADGRLAADTLRNSAADTTVSSSRLTYDAQGRVLRREDPLVLYDTLALTYSGLGHLLTSHLSQHGFTTTGLQWTYGDQETFTYDNLGNRTTAVTDAAMNTTDPVSGTVNPLHVNHNGTTYEAGTGRLLTDQELNSGITAYTYDEAGNEHYSLRNQAEYAGGLVPQERGSFYGLDGRLRMLDWRWLSSAAEASVPWKRVVEQYRYDALGRRVWTQAVKTCSYPSYSGVEQAECKTSLVRRTVWDGSQELGEIQMPLAQAETDGSFTPLALITGQDGTSGDPNPWFGQAVYLHGLELDRPVAITRLNYVQAKDPNPFNPSPGSPVTKPPLTVVPFWNAQGDAPAGEFNTGEIQACTPPGSGLMCAGVPWLLFWSAYDRQRALWDNWWGTELQGKRDKSGLEYKRNRYYDPQTGRFTQEDPIGLAGGLNLYGFANGDPVNFSDPFGLFGCKEHPETCADALGSAGFADPTLYLGGLARGIVGGAGKLLATRTATSATERVLFEGGKDALKDALGKGLEGVNSKQASALFQTLKEGSADAIKVVTGENGLVSYTTRAGRNGYQTLVRIFDESGQLKRMAQAAWDAAGRFVHGEVWK